MAITDRTDSRGLIRTQTVLLCISVSLFAVKIMAWSLTGSVAILTDALESTVNVIAGAIGLYSIRLSSKPRDLDHPYGHGKVEFISAAVEGILISVAGLIIIYESLNNLIHPHTLQKLDYGLLLIAFSGLVNYITGVLVIRKGKNENSPVLISGGKHLISDTYSTVGILLGVALILLTGYVWIDSAAAMLFAFVIIGTGYRIIRSSVSGMMDESDQKIIREIIVVLNEKRIPAWIDVHNMRVINYAGFYHIDCHLTVPFYINVEQAHHLQDKLTDMLRLHFKDRIEFFIHIDACVEAQCRICNVENCPERKSVFEETILWEYENVIANSKHGLKNIK